MTVWLALGVSTVSLALSVATYWRGRVRSVLGRQQVAELRVAASRCLLFWDQLLTAVGAEVHELDLDAYFLPSVKVNAGRLEESIDTALGLGLWQTIVGVREHAVTMHSAFRQSLVDVASDPDSEKLTKLHLLMGMIRLLDGLSGEVRRVGDAELAEALRAAATGHSISVEHAWTYLQPDSDSS